MQQATTHSIRLSFPGGRSTARILAVALALASSAACESSSPYPESASDRARELLALIEECEHTAGRDTERLRDCVPDASPGLSPLVLSLIDGHRFFGFGESMNPGIDALLEKLASEADDPVLRAAARYYVAAGLMRSTNTLWELEDPGARPQGALAAAWQRAVVARRSATRERAVEAATRFPTLRSTRASEIAVARQAALGAATGLSAGVGEEEFRGYGTGGMRSRTFAGTFAEAEADLIRSIRHGTVGGTLPELTGTRLDGAEESLSAYRGRVVLLDIWATWCSPCVGALPELRELVAELPPERFVLLAISVDEKRETVTRFMDNEPMPWMNWHVGVQNDIVRTLDVGGLPTYMLIDAQGRIRARDHGLTDRFTSLIRTTVEG